MGEQKLYVFKENINQDAALKLYKKRIKEDLRFEDQIDEKFLTIEECYNSYYFYDCSIQNHAYFFKDKKTNESYDGKIDVQYAMSDKDFILNELNKKDATEIEEDEFSLYDAAKKDRVFKEFVEGIKDKILQNITSKHHVKPSRIVHIDVAPLEELENLTQSIYYEKIYIFRYRNEQQSKDFVSILSSFNKEFYTLDFVKSLQFLEYLTKFKRPIEYIPKEYLVYYYKDSFQVYVQINKMLEYETPKTILKKIRDNIHYENYSLYPDYLKGGIFYFRINKYLKKLSVVSKPLKQKIYLSYLTLKYQEESGLFLYECATLGLLSKNRVNDKIHFLECSYKLGSLKAKKALYEHYNFPLYFDSARVKKYS